jgi:hypothetical protein
MTLNVDELSLIEAMRKKLDSHIGKNEELERYYEGKNRLKDFRISIPPQLTAVDSVVGWAGTAVQVLEERLDFEGYIGADTLGLNDIYRANDLDVESSFGHIDSLVYGTGFVVIGKGDNGEPDPLITIESPKRMTSMYDMRLRRQTSAFSIEKDAQGNPLSGTLYLPDSTIRVAFRNGTWVEVDRDDHNLGRLPVVALANNPRSSDPNGRSEITRAVRSYTDAAMRTLLGAEVAREFYSAPQRYILGADEDLFQDADGNALNPWSVYQGRILGVPANQDGQIPQVGQFAANSTTPYFEQVRAYATMLAAETAIPASYLGFQTDNPSSADAIRQMEARLVKRAERRQKQFGRAWTEVAKLALLVRDGEIPAEASDIRPQWRDASTPTRAAAADEAVKLIGAGVLLADSEVTYNRIGLSDTDKQVLQSEKSTSRARSLVQNLATAAAATTRAPEETSGEGNVVDEFQGIRNGDEVTLLDGRTGVVEHIMTGGTLGIPGSPFAIETSPTDPGMTIRLIENGELTETLINIRFSDVDR